MGLVSLTDSHLVPVARAARVVPLSAEAFDGLSCPSCFYLKSDNRVTFRIFSPDLQNRCC